MKRILTPEDLDPTDWKYVSAEPEPGFSPEKNAANIKKAIDSGIKIEIELRKAGMKDMQYRIDAVSSYARHISSTNSGVRFEDYMGKFHMAQIYGEKIMEKIRIMESVQRLNRASGNTLEGGKFFLT